MTGKSEMKIYLAGPINGRTDSECRNWRLQAKQFFGEQNVLDPMRRDYRGRELEPGTPAKIVEQDKEDILSSSAVLVYFDAPSVGTSMEVHYAYTVGKPVFVALAAPINVPVSPWMVYHAKFVSPTLRDAMFSCLVWHEHASY